MLKDECTSWNTVCEKWSDPAYLEVTFGKNLVFPSFAHSSPMSENQSHAIFNLSVPYIDEGSEPMELHWLWHERNREVEREKTGWGARKYRR